MRKIVTIRHLLDKQLKVPLIATVGPANPGSVAHAADISVFGYGRDDAEALEVLKQGIESICLDEEYLDLRTTIQRIFLQENLMADREREVNDYSSPWGH